MDSTTLTDNSSKTVIELDKNFSTVPQAVTLTGTTLGLADILAVARYDSEVAFTTDKTILDRISTTYKKMMEDVKNGIPIYGCNTGYGAQASHVLNHGTAARRLSFARKISEGIAHVDVTTGPTFGGDVVRAAMLIRINMLMQGVSAVKLSDLDMYRQILNARITPVVNMYGGIGASGDLAHNGRVLSALRHLPGTKVTDKNGKSFEAQQALKKAGIGPLRLDPKAGLGLVNGDNFSTALATLLAVDTLEALILAMILGAMTIEVLRGSSRSFHPVLSAVRPHSGQKEVAEIYRYLLGESNFVYEEMDGHKLRGRGVRVQDGYSLRGIPQYHGVNIEKIKTYFDIITRNANSVSDNPLWVPPEHTVAGEKPWQWVSGANFMAMHMVEVMDGLRKTMTQIVKLNDRHMAKMINKKENNGLPANLSDKKAVTQCVFKGVQIQSGMYDVYSTLLSIPVSTFFGVHEEGNQDITAHSLTSGILGLENLRITRYSIAQNLLALTQAVDLRGKPDQLSPKTLPVYEFVRKRIAYVQKEQPLHNEIELLYEEIVSGKLMGLIRKKVLQDFIGS